MADSLSLESLPRPNPGHRRALELLSMTEPATGSAYLLSACRPALLPHQGGFWRAHSHPRRLAGQQEPLGSLQAWLRPSCLGERNHHQEAGLALQTLSERTALRESEHGNHEVGE